MNHGIPVVVPSGAAALDSRSPAFSTPQRTYFFGYTLVEFIGQFNRVSMHPVSYMGEEQAQTTFRKNWRFL